jgi:hypothetical protein
MNEGLSLLNSEWTWILDADIVLPVRMDDKLDAQCLHSPYRYMCPLLEGLDWASRAWGELPLKDDREMAGYCQVFDLGVARGLAAGRPLYGERWSHAGGCDSDFAKLWPKDRQRRLGWKCLHIGTDCVNWCGRVEGIEQDADVASRIAAREKLFGDRAKYDKI